MDTIRVESAYFDKVFDLGNSDTGSRGHDEIEFPNLARFKEKPYTQAIYAGVVTNDGEIPNTFFACGINEIFRNPAKAKAAGHDRGALLQVCDRFARVAHDLIHSDSPCLNRLSISSKFPPSIESRTR